MRPRAACTASGSASSTPCRPRRSSRSRATRCSTARPSPRASPPRQLETSAPTPNRRGTTVTFTPDPEIFGADAAFYAGAPLQARPLQGLSLRRGRDPLALRPVARLRRRPRSRGLPVPGRPRRPSRRAARRPPDRHQPALRRQAGLSRRPGLRERPRRPSRRADRRPPAVTNQPFTGRQDFPNDQGSAEWAVAWPLYSDGSESYYCNTIPTPDGGTHEAGLRAALTKGIRAFGELVGNKKAKDITADDVFNGVELMLCVFIRNPHFQSQTKDRLTSLEAARFVEAAVRDHFDHYLADNMDRGRALLGSILERMDERLRRRAEREVQRKTATSARKLRLPGKLTDCSQRRPRRHRTVHRRGRQRRRLGQAGARPQDPGDPPHPRQDPQRRLAPPPTRSAPTRKSPTSTSRSAAASATSSTRTRCATSGSSS